MAFDGQNRRGQGLIYPVAYTPGAYTTGLVESQALGLAHEFGRTHQRMMVSQIFCNFSVTRFITSSSYVNISESLVRLHDGVTSITAAVYQEQPHGDNIDISYKLTLDNGTSTINTEVSQTHGRDSDENFVHEITDASNGSVFRIDQDKYDGNISTSLITLDVTASYLDTNCTATIAAKSATTLKAHHALQPLMVCIWWNSDD